MADLGREVRQMIAEMRKLLKATAGFGLLVIGVLLSIPGVPGPGILLILAGLWLLSDQFPWARRALAWGKDRLARLRERRLRWGPHEE
jgi:hypothetical protein